MKDHEEIKDIRHEIELLEKTAFWLRDNGTTNSVVDLSDNIKDRCKNILHDVSRLEAKLDMARKMVADNP